MNAQNGDPCPANKLVITPFQRIPDHAVFKVTVFYTGRPGVHTDGDRSTEGWFRTTCLRAAFSAPPRTTQRDYCFSSITERQLEAGFHAFLPNQSTACYARLDQFFTQWFDTVYPPDGGANRPQITGPGLTGRASTTRTAPAADRCRVRARHQRSMPC